MKTFLTEYRHSGKLWCGADIYANSWHVAELIGMELGVNVWGIKRGEVSSKATKEQISKVFDEITETA